MHEQEEKEVWERLTALESSYKSEHKRLDRMEGVVDSIQEIVVEIKHMREDLNKVTNKVTEIESKPQKRWDTLITAAISALTSGVLGFVVAQLIGG